jgi:hypothetical protein
LSSGKGAGQFPAALTSIDQLGTSNNHLPSGSSAAYRHFTTEETIINGLAAWAFKRDGDSANSLKPSLFHSSIIPNLEVKALLFEYPTIYVQCEGVKSLNKPGFYCETSHANGNPIAVE